jgi:hypothetical protein
MTSNRISRHGWLWGVAALIIASFVFAMTDGTPAQTTKAKKKEVPDAPKKEAKVEPPPTTFPKRVDFIDAAQGGTQHVTFIDEQVTKMWKENKTYPSDRCTDYEFIRRASLDIVGRIPTVKEVNNFMGHPAEKRRSWLINAMLDGSEYGAGTEYAQNFANLWTTHLITRSGSPKQHQLQLNDWLYTGFKGGDGVTPDWSKMARQLIAGTGRQNENAAVNYMMYNLGEEIKADQSKNGKWDMVPATSRTTRLFVGIRIQCVQCHDHPFNGEWRQEDFWGINAFLRQSDTPEGPPEMVMIGKKKVKGEKRSLEKVLADNRSYNSSGIIPYERRNTVLLFTDPSYLNHKKIPKNWTGSRREALAKFILEDPYFAKAFVNRMWGHFFGMSFLRGNPDDFHDQNPISHPELLEKLAGDFSKDYGHNPKVLIRWICNSQAYGLSSRANKWNDKTDDETLFARMLLKPMSPEQMFESIMHATIPSFNRNKVDEKRDKWLEKLVVNFGNDEGEEGSFSGTVVQALLLMNGQDINAQIAAKDGTVAAIASTRGASLASLPAAVNDLYMHALSRPATKAEIAHFASPEKYALHKGTKSTPAQFWPNYYQDIYWALLNSNEFILNH